MRKGVPLRLLLLGGNAAVLLLPIAGFLLLRGYDAYLLRQTERQLLAESAVIGEVFREAYRAQAGIAHDEHRPPAMARDTYAPIEPRIDVGVHVQPPQTQGLTPAVVRESPAERAGASIEPLLRRAQTFNLSAIRVLDERGCVVATTRSEAGMCMPMLPEVRQALSGHYAAIARERISDEPPPPLGDLRRRGSARVFIAVPVFSDGRVIAVIRASRTGLDALSSLWANRRGLLWGALLTAGLAISLSLLFSAAIAWPLRRITHAAKAVAEGQAQPRLSISGFAPAEIHVLSRALERMTQTLSERARYVEQFASNVSHELKTPITSIRGAAELLQQDWAGMEDAQRKRFIDNIESDASRMDRLVSRLLLLARLDNPSHRDGVDPLRDLQNAREDAAHDLPVVPFVRGLLERHGARVQLVLQDPPVTLRISEDHLATVIGNLLDNALRHGAGKPVQVVLGAEAARLRIEVCNEGPDISAANRERLFDRFFTTERDRGGTGLGLAIVKAVATARGGRAEVSSRQGTTVFRVVL